MLEKWEVFRARLGSPQHRYSLLLAALWPVVVLVIAVLAIRLGLQRKTSQTSYLLPPPFCGRSSLSQS